MNFHSSWILVLVVLAACAQTQQAERPNGPPAIGKPWNAISCAESDLASRSAMPAGTFCNNDMFSLPMESERRLITISHWRAVYPFELFEVSQITISEDSNRKNIAWIDHSMDVVVRARHRILRDVLEAEGWEFRWIDNSNVLRAEPDEMFVERFSVERYPSRRCVLIRYQLRNKLNKDSIVERSYGLSCWKTDFKSRRVDLEVVVYSFNISVDFRLNSLPAFDAEASAFFQSLEPPR